MNTSQLVQAVLFAIFAALTGALTWVIAPTYDNLFVPEMAPSALFPPLTISSTSGDLMARAAAFSVYLVANVVDPLAVLVILVLGILYLLRASLPARFAAWKELAPRFVLGILVANAVVPLATFLWDLASAVYPLFYDYGGGAWRVYGNLVPAGGLAFSWDNGVLTFLVALAMFMVIFLLALVVELRDALVATLLVLLPPLTLLWPIPSLAGFARKAWKLFGEMIFLPCLMVVPLALAVGAGNVLLVLALLGLAAGMPQLLSQAGASFGGLGFPHVGGVVSGDLSTGSRGVRRSVGEWGRSASRGIREGVTSPRPRGGAVGAPLHAAGPGGYLAGKMGEGLGRLASHLAARARSPTTGFGPGAGEGTRLLRPLPRSLRIGGERPSTPSG